MNQSLFTRAIFSSVPTWVSTVSSVVMYRAEPTSANTPIYSISSFKIYIKQNLHLLYFYLPISTFFLLLSFSYFCFHRFIYFSFPAFAIDVFDLKFLFYLFIFYYISSYIRSFFQLLYSCLSSFILFAF